MASEHTLPAHEALKGSLADPLIGVLTAPDGEPIVRYAAREIRYDGDDGGDRALRAALAVIGAWRELDWVGLAADLDRLRHDVPPTPSIDH